MIISQNIRHSEYLKYPIHTCTLSLRTFYPFAADSSSYVFAWEAPSAWDSERLYPWGEQAEDKNMLNERKHWWDMYSCTDVRLNGRVGAPFFNQRYYSINVSNSK